MGAALDPSRVVRDRDHVSKTASSASRSVYAFAAAFRRHHRGAAAPAGEDLAHSIRT
jgi:hypothetical protein